MTRLYHPDLGVEVDVPDTSAAVLAESGWEFAPEPEVRPGYVPEPVRYVPDLRTDTEREADDNAANARRKRAKTDPVEGEDTSK